MSDFPDAQFRAGVFAAREEAAKKIKQQWDAVRDDHRIRSIHNLMDSFQTYNQGFRHAIEFALRVLEEEPAFELSVEEQAVLALLSDGGEHKTNAIIETLDGYRSMIQILNRLEKLGFITHRSERVEGTTSTYTNTYWRMVGPEEQEVAAVESDRLKSRLGLESSDFAVYPEVVLILRKALR